MMQNYEQLVDRIAREAKLEREEINRRVEAKRAKFSNFISKEGAAQVVAAELGISFDNQKMKISELVAGMKRVNTTGKIINLYPSREFEKNGRKGKVLNMIIADETGNIKTVLWDTNHISLFDNGDIKKGDVIEIKNGAIRNNELHLSSFSDVRLSKEKIDKVKIEMNYSMRKIRDINEGNAAMFRGIVVQIFEPRMFEVCPECKKKVSPETGCETHGKVIPLKRALLNLVVDDGTETIRTILFNEQMGKIGINAQELENHELFLQKRNSLLGMEALFSGIARKNKMFNNTELFIDDIKEIDIDNLINELEK